MMGLSFKHGFNDCSKSMDRVKKGKMDVLCVVFSSDAIFFNKVYIEGIFLCVVVIRMCNDTMCNRLFLLG